MKKFVCTSLQIMGNQSSFRRWGKTWSDFCARKIIFAAAFCTDCIFLRRHGGKPVSRELQQSICDRTSEQTRVFTVSVVRKLRMEFICCSSRNAPLHTFRTCWCSERVLSSVYYCNSLLTGLPQCLLKKTQSVQNTAERMIFRAPKFDHVSPLFQKLHWLPISCRIEQKDFFIVLWLFFWNCATILIRPNPGVYVF